MRSILVAFLVAVLVGPVVLYACSIPVFRYALERWDADLYRVMVFAASPDASADAAEAAAYFDQRLAMDGGGNFRLKCVDVSKLNDGDKAQWKEAGWTGETPSLVVRYPERNRQRTGVCWQGTPSRAVAEAMVDSPARKTLVRDLASGVSIVWVLVGGSDTAEALLRRDLLAIEKEFATPAEKGDPQDPLADSPRPPTVFRIIRVSPADPAEKFLVAFLTGGKDVGEGKVYPVFGRGRVLGEIPVAEAKIETLREATVFLSGDCSCEIKEQNPGYDLLLSSVWDSFVEVSPAAGEAPPPIAGLSKPVAPSPALPVSPQAQTVSVKKGSSAPAPVPVAPVRSGRLWIVLAGAVGIIAVVAAVGTAFLRKKGEE